MAENPGKKFPTPIPNPIAEQEEPTDPGIVVPASLLSSKTASAVDSEEPSQPQIQVKAQVPQIPPPPSPQGDPHAPLASPEPRLLTRMPELGPLDPFMKDPTISEIMVNDLRNVMIEKDGKLQFSGFAYSSIDELNRLTRNILDVTGRIVSPDNPYVDTMLPDGSRVNIVVPPLTIYGPCLTIRKFPSKQIKIHDLIQMETLDQRIAYFLNSCVLGRMNILICGGTGAGKTTLLNVLTTFVPKGERIITIEDTPELTLKHFNSVRLQTKPQSPTSPPVTARDLVANSLRMRPDRIIVGECRKAEAFDMLQAMNTGHQGSMTTLHANTPRDGLARLETLCMLAGVDLPVTAIRKQIASALDLIIQIHRSRSGKRRITSVTEVTGMEGDTITLQDIFSFEVDTEDPAGSDSGHFKTSGLVPTLLERLRENGIELPNSYFS